MKDTYTFTVLWSGFLWSNLLSQRKIFMSTNHFCRTLKKCKIFWTHVRLLLFKLSRPCDLIAKRFFQGNFSIYFLRHLLTFLQSSDIYSPKGQKHWIYFKKIIKACFRIFGTTKRKWLLEKNQSCCLMQYKIINNYQILSLLYIKVINAKFLFFEKQT